MSAATRGSLTFAEIVSGTKRNPKSTSALTSERNSNGNTHSRPSASGGQSPRPIVVNGSSGSGSRQPWNLAPIPKIFPGRKPTFPSRVTTDQTNQRLPEIRESPVEETACDATAALHDPFEEAHHASHLLPSAVTHETYELQPTNAAHTFETGWSAAPTPSGLSGGYMAPERLAPAPYIPGGSPHTLSMPNSAFGTYNSPPWAAGGAVSPTNQSPSTPRRRRARTTMKLANLSTADVIKRVKCRLEEHDGRSSDKHADADALADEKTMAGLQSICDVFEEPDVRGTILEVATRMCQQSQQPLSPDELEWFSNYWHPLFSALSARCGLEKHEPWATVQAYLSAKRSHMLKSLVQSRHSMPQATLLPPSHT